MSKATSLSPGASTPRSRGSPASRCSVPSPNRWSNSNSTRSRRAKRAGVRRIVKMSAIKAAPDAPTTIRRWHGAIEQRINRSGIAYTHLWPNAFMQNFRRFAPLIRERGEFYAPVGDARISLVEIEDVAAVTAAALVEDGHEGETYENHGAGGDLLCRMRGDPLRRPGQARALRLRQRRGRASRPRRGRHRAQGGAGARRDRRPVPRGLRRTGDRRGRAGNRASAPRLPHLRPRECGALPVGRQHQ